MTEARSDNNCSFKRQKFYSERRRHFILIHMIIYCIFIPYGTSTEMFISMQKNLALNESKTIEKFVINHLGMTIEFYVKICTRRGFHLSSNIYNVQGV